MKKFDYFMKCALFTVLALFSVMSGWNRLNAVGACSVNAYNEIRNFRKGNVYELIDGELVEVTDNVQLPEIYFPDGSSPALVWDS